MKFQQISQRGKEYLKTAETLLRSGQTMTDQAIAGRRQLSSLRQARIHPHDESTPQKSISGQLGSRPFKNYLSNCGIVAIGLTVDAHAMDSLIDDDRFRCQSLRQT